MFRIHFLPSKEQHGDTAEKEVEIDFLVTIYIDWPIASVTC
jgi:hypothetical protein